MVELSGEQKFWAVVGGVTVVVLAVLVLWALPAWSAARGAEQAWRAQVDKLDLLRHEAAKIPSEKALQDRRGYMEWLDGQVREAENFFYDRSRILSDALPGEEKEISPSEFKEAYIGAIRDAQAVLSRKRRLMKLLDEKQAYPMYDWQEGASLPKPEDFEKILQKYWAHYYMYSMFLGAKVREVREIRISEAVTLQGELKGMHVRANVALYPDDSRDLIRRLLEVSSGTGRRSKPIVQLQSFRILPDAGDAEDPLVNVQFEGYMLLFPKSAEQRPAKPAEE